MSLIETEITEEKKLTRTSLETKDQIIDLFHQGYNSVQIDQKLNLGKGTSNYHIGKYKKHQALGTRKPIIATKFAPSTDTDTSARKRLSDQQIETLMDGYVMGETFSIIGPKIGCHYTTAAEYIRRFKSEKKLNRMVKKACKRMGIEEPVARPRKVRKTTKAENTDQTEMNLTATNTEITQKPQSKITNQNTTLVAQTDDQAELAQLRKELEREKIKNEVLMEIAVRKN